MILADSGYFLRQRKVPDEKMVQPKRTLATKLNDLKFYSKDPNGR